jgi:hypothetical protein
VNFTNYGSLHLGNAEWSIIILDCFIFGIVRILNGTSILEFFVEERLGEREPKDYWLEVRYDLDNSYLANKAKMIYLKPASE